MTLRDRFFGRGVPRPGGLPVANMEVANPVALQLLYDVPLDLDADGVTLALRAFHPELAAATAELEVVAPGTFVEPGSGEDTDPSVIGLIAWERHVVKVIGFPEPMPAEAVQACVQPAHFVPELKEAAYQHVAYVVLFYAGYENDPLERYVALAAAAAALTRFGAIVAMNEASRSAVPAMVLLPHEEDAGDTLAALRDLPIPFLYAGFVKLEVEGEPGIWMRTYGCHTLKLPDLAFRADGHHVGTAIFNAFSNMLAYLRDSGRTFVPGDTMRVGDDLYLRMRAPTEAEWYLQSEGEMLVGERIAADEAIA